MKGKENKKKRYFCDFHKSLFENGSFLDYFSTGTNVILTISVILCVIAMGIGLHSITKDNYYNEKLYKDLEKFVVTCIEEKDIEKLEKGVDSLAISYKNGEATIECTREEEHCSATVTTTLKVKLFSYYEIIGQTRDFNTEKEYKIKNGISFFFITFVSGIATGGILSAILRLIIKIASKISYWHRYRYAKKEAKKQKEMA